jgi:WhiB family redox-sensing transcriptional regulator
MSAVNPDDYFEVIAAGLDRLEHVPDGVLWAIVTREGSCMWLYRLGLEPEWTGDEPDRELATRSCAGCPVRAECLEFELRIAGEQTVGVWGALNEDDRRALHKVWLCRRRADLEEMPEAGEWV